MTANRLAPVALALLLVLAGCGGQTGPGTGTETAATTTAPTTETAGPSQATSTPANGSADAPTAYSVTVENGTLPVNSTRTYRRVQGLLGTDVEPRPVEIRNLSEWRSTLPRVAAAPINDALGYENVTADWSQPTGATRLTGYVYLHPGEGSPDAVERTLAHEFVHSIQFQASAFPWLDRLPSGRVTVDDQKVYRSLQEGSAVYVADIYTRQYLDVETNSAFVREYMNSSATHWSALAPYYFGSRYLASQVDSPRNLSTVLENRPLTTEQVIHNYTRAEEPPATLTVETNATASSWDRAGNNTLGEMTTRGALGTELSRSRAATAAAGWGTDELVVFQNRTGQANGWVWTHRWDTADDASEAADAFETYAERRDADSERDYRLVPVDDRTTALVFGTVAFVGNTTVADSNGTVAVRVGA